MGLWKQLQAGQTVCMLLGSAISGFSLNEHGFSTAALPVFTPAAILVAIGWIGPQIIHELAEINDQLAGRSKEFHGFLSELREPPSAD